MSQKYFCVHGHFYQPPREDPLTGVIPREPGAAPFNNWNERIQSQCYKPNAVHNNYEHMSFNIGPTLVDWMDDFDPDTLNSIIRQDQDNFKRYGIGNAMAQAYNHTILPLAAYHDKKTQVVWGIADFEHRFGHKPAGMWLPETAVNDETLSVLAENGIDYTILAPWQAADEDVDVSHPYRVHLPQGQKINVFFYNRDLSTRVSFDPGATVNADRFLGEILMPQYSRNLNGNGNGTEASAAMAETVVNDDEPQLQLIASDGELYGHHQPFREKFLAYLLDGATKGYDVQVTYPGLWLREHPTRESMTILQNTSWSCHHGIMRWTGNCGCTPFSEWKAPLRLAFDRLAQAIDEQYLKALAKFRLEDPWELRHRYIHVIHGDLSLADLFGEVVGQKADAELLDKMGLLLQAQFERQRMFTSCGWFFDDFDRIEPKNNVAYVAQAVWLTYHATGVDLSPLAKSLLGGVQSRRTGLRGDTVFDMRYKMALNS